MSSQYRKGQSVNAQAAEWLVRQHSEEFSLAEQAALESWLDEDPAHAVAYARAESAWERAGRLRARRGLVSAEAPALSDDQRHDDQKLMGGWRNERDVSRPRTLQKWAPTCAAVFAVILCGAGYWFWASYDRNTYTTGVGERRFVALPDGSSVNLNTSSHLEVDFSDRQRTIRLVGGEGLFEVAHDPSRPFVVEAGDAIVRAVGTAFNVRLRGQIAEVTVTEGTVEAVSVAASVRAREAAGSGASHFRSTADPQAVAAPDGTAARVFAGSSAVIAPGAVTRIPLDADVLRRRVAWRDGVIELKGETLEQAVQEFNRYRAAKLIIGDPEIASIRVGGRFQTDEADRFLSALKSGFGVRVVEGEGGTVYLLRAE